ncbi:MAG: hypothetical protein RJA33_156 [Actinomycetota bacterium]|jgi:hypothetical protein
MRSGRRIGFSSLALTLLAGMLQPTFVPSAAASITTAACRDTFGTPANVTVAVTGSDCLLYFYGNSTWTPAPGYSTVRFLLVGGGAAGRLDGGGGGGGGGGLAHPSLPITSGVTANVVVGTGGNADSQSNGGQSRLDTNNDGTFEWTANGGSIGGGWDTRLGGSAGSASAPAGATALTGGNGGAGPSTQYYGTSAAGAGANGFTSDITGTTYSYGGGGGGGIGSHSNGTNTYDVGPANGGSGGGGAGAAQRARGTTVTWSYLGVNGGSESLIATCASGLYVGSTIGFQGKAGFGGGGGGGTAYGDGCTGSPNTTSDGERNRGGHGGSGVVIIRYTPDATAPVITGPGSATGSTSSISIPENSTSVFSFTANETVTWSKSGADNSRFTLTSNVLTISARDFETPESTLSSNTYVVVITATDASTNAASQTVSVTITNVNETPTITAFASADSGSLSSAENISSLYTVTATDVDAGTAFTYSLTGTDAADFRISASGVLSFVSAPDFEGPIDADTNNTYLVVTWVSDGTLSDSQTVTITVTNVNESGSASGPTVTGSAYKGVSISLITNVNAAGKVRFFINGKRIANCLSVSTTGSYPNISATCNWKPAVTGRNFLTATLTPTSSTFTSVTSARSEIWVLKRSTSR